MDWKVIRALDFNLTLGPYHDRLIALYEALLKIDERRAEALLHVWPTIDVQLPLVPAAAYGRWERGRPGDVLLFEDAGVATNRRRRRTDRGTRRRSRRGNHPDRTLKGGGMAKTPNLAALRAARQGSGPRHQADAHRTGGEGGQARLAVLA